jgi:hypothetical protein
MQRQGQPGGSTAKMGKTAVFIEFWQRYDENNDAIPVALFFRKPFTPSQRLPLYG